MSIENSQITKIYKKKKTKSKSENLVSTRASKSHSPSAISVALTGGQKSNISS